MPIPPNPAYHEAGMASYLAPFCPLPCPSSAPSHVHPLLPPPRLVTRTQVWISDIGIAAMAGLLVAWAKTYGFYHMAAIYLFPLVFTNCWLVLYTWMQVSECDICPSFAPPSCHRAICTVCHGASSLFTHTNHPLCPMLARQGTFLSALSRSEKSTAPSQRVRACAVSTAPSLPGPQRLIA